MSKEYDSDRITPENAEEKIHFYLKNAQVGSVEFIAFSNALEWRKSLNKLHEYRRVIEIIERGGAPPKGLAREYGSRTQIESELRVAEVNHALADFEGNKNGSIIPGYIGAYVFSQELIVEFEKKIMQELKFDLGDLVLSEIRGRAEAHDFAMENLFERETDDQNSGSHWLRGLLQGLK